MPLPLIPIAIGVMAVSAAAQWWNSKQAQEANEEEIAEMKALLSRVQEPDFDVSELTPVQAKMVSNVNPKLAQYFVENMPQIFSRNQDMQRSREIENQQLGRFQEQSVSRSDPIFEANMNRAARTASSESESARRTADAIMQRRGVGAGSGLGMQQGLYGASDAMQRLALMGEQAAMGKFERGQNAQRQAADIANRQYNADSEMERYNVGNINEYNQRLASGMNQSSLANAQIQNQAMQFNAGQAQNVENMNVQSQNNFAQDNRSNRNAMAQNQFQNSMSKITGQMGVAQQSQANRNLGTQATNQAIQSVGDAAITGIAYADARQQNANAAANNYSNDRQQLFRNAGDNTLVSQDSRYNLGIKKPTY